MFGATVLCFMWCVIGLLCRCVVVFVCVCYIVRAIMLNPIVCRWCLCIMLPRVSCYSDVIIITCSSIGVSSIRAGSCITSRSNSSSRML